MRLWPHDLRQRCLELGFVFAASGLAGGFDEPALLFVRCELRSRLSEPYYIAYIDEAGDPGLTRVRPQDPNGSSEWLVLGATAWPEQKDYVARCFYCVAPSARPAGPGASRR